jgi:hypothetical protein
MSDKRATQAKEYAALREEHLKENPMCAGWLVLNSFSPEEIKEIQDAAAFALWQGSGAPRIPARRRDLMATYGLPQHCPRSCDLHHSHGRGTNYIKTEYFMALARSTHDWCHTHPSVARQHGLLQ